MRLISFQHKEAVSKILNEGIYYCDRVSNYHNATPECYKMLSSKLDLKENTYCIFAWYNILGLPIKLTLESLNRAYEMSPLDLGNYMILELNVPDEYVNLQDFYNFVDRRFFEEFKEKFDMPTWDEVFSISNDRETQAVIPCIKKEWVIDIYKLCFEEQKFYDNITSFKSINN